MIALIQRVTDANVMVDGRVVAEIDQGVLALVAVEKNDQHANAQKLLKRILNYRLFSDPQNKMNLCVKDIKGGLLLVPQFTLAADTNSGNRPSFSTAAPPDLGKQLFSYITEQADLSYDNVASGIFGADMKVTLCNDGPVTFWLTS